MKLNADVDVDPESIMDELDDDELLTYLNERGIGPSKDRDLVNEFFHGDLDLKKLFRDIGKPYVTKVIGEFVREENLIL